MGPAVLARGLQEVIDLIELKRDRAKVDVAIRVVRGRDAGGHGGASLALDLEGELAGDIGATKVWGHVELLGAHKVDRDGLARRIRVAEREIAVLETRGASQRSVALILNGHVEGEVRRRGRHTLVAETVSHLVGNVRNRPGVARASSETLSNKAGEYTAVVGQGPELHLAVDVRGSGNDPAGVLAIDQAEVEVVIEHEAVRHGLRANNRTGLAGGDIGVHEGDLRSGVRVRTGNVGVRVVDTG